MKELTIGEIHSILLDIMAEVDMVCRSNGIRYTLAFGTYLGAVRHGGFIPWDDDIDIIMPRPDFERFLKVWAETPGLKYHCLYDSTDKDEFYRMLFAKVVDPCTTNNIDGKKSTFRFGVSVDIFPLDAVPSDPQEQHKHMKGIIHDHHRLFFRHRKFPHGAPLAIIEAHLHSYEYWRNRCLKAAAKYDYDSCGYIAHIIGSRTYESVHRKALFDDLIEVPFEDRSFLGFRDAKAYLTQVFGPDYMTPPPPEKRAAHGKMWYR